MELINLLNIGMASFNVRHQVPSNVHATNQFIPDLGKLVKSEADRNEGMKRQRSIKVEGEYDLNQFDPGKTRQTRRRSGFLFQIKTGCMSQHILSWSSENAGILYSVFSRRFQRVA